MFHNPATVDSTISSRLMDEAKTSSKRSLSPPAPAEGNEGQGRQRSRAACTPCRQRKRKCDGRMPCATCVRYEYKCEYSTMKRTSSLQDGDQNQEAAPPQPVGHTKPSIIQLQAHPLTAPGARFHHRSILDPTKTRFVRANSTIAFPRILGMDLESGNIPRLHSFAQNLGIRPESTELSKEITTLLTWPEMQRLTDSYFRKVRPDIGLLDEAEFVEQATARFSSPTGLSDWDAMALGVAALGSFFSPHPHPREDEFVFESTRSLVQFSLQRSPSSNHVAGWILRSLYLRLTSRPHASWITSCITLHQAEACGLHKEMQTIAVVYPAAPQGDHKLAKTRRRLFWIARALNIIFSFEYGRSRVNFDVTTTKKFAAENGSSAHQLVELADLLPNDFVDREREPDPPAALSAALTKIVELQSDSSFIAMLKADLAFGIYRRLWLMSLTDAKDRSDTIISIGTSALKAAVAFLESRTPWWNVVGVPFQFVCVLLAVGTPKSLSHVPETLKLLRSIAQKYDTHMTREAYNQASTLVKMSRKRKEKELEMLNSATGEPLLQDYPSTGSTEMTEAPNIDWAMDLPFEWDIFLNPDLVMSQQQGQSAVDAAYGSQLGF